MSGLILVFSKLLSSCPALCRASTSWMSVHRKDVDGRDKPGHDDGAKCLPQTNERVIGENNKLARGKIVERIFPVSRLA